MAQNESEKMTLTPSELRVFRTIALVRRYALLPLQALLILLKLFAGWNASWWFVLLPSFLYLLIPPGLGVLGPILQHRRFQREQRQQPEGESR